MSEEGIGGEEKWSSDEESTNEAQHSTICYYNIHASSTDLSTSNRHQNNFKPDQNLFLIFSCFTSCANFFTTISSFSFSIVYLDTSSLFGCVRANDLNLETLLSSTFQVSFLRNYVKIFFTFCRKSKSLFNLSSSTLALFISLIDSGNFSISSRSLFGYFVTASFETWSLNSILSNTFRNSRSSSLDSKHKANFRGI